MGKIHSRRRNKKARNAVIYIVLILLLLLLIVFIISLFDKPQEAKGDTEKGLQTGSGASATGAGSISTSQTVVTEADEMADNAWAMFLVNNNNPLPADYDDTLENDIGLTLVFKDYRDYFMDSRAAPYVMQMVEDAAEDGVDLYIVSTYRTQEYQQNNLDESIKDRMNQGMDYETAYADALESVMMPGRSEHNAGIAADIMTHSYTSMEDDGFKDTDAYRWLSENAHKYGFILRYPEGKTDITGIIYEPWHYRFLGVYYATKVRESRLTLEEYFDENGWVDDNGTATAHLGPAEKEEQKAPEKPSENTLPPDAITVTVNSETGTPIVVN
jgi:D-alanyl-D-alanine carboxypeptidase